MTDLTSHVVEILKTYPAGLIQGAVVNGVFTTFVFVVFWRLFAAPLSGRKIQPGKDVKGSQIRRELKNAAIVMSLNALFASVVLYLVSQGVAKVYLDILAYPFWWTFLSFPLLLILNDTWFYWMHRLLHHRRLYKYVHHEHHKSTTVNPFTSFSFHVIEPLLLTVWIIPAVLIMPLYVPVIAFVQLYGLLDNMKSHLGYELYPKGFNRSPLRFLTTATYHDLHHTRFKGNYALHFRFWDWIMGTENKKYEEAFQDAHRPRETATDDVDDANQGII